MLTLILLLQVSWLDPFENILDEQVKAIKPDEIRWCVTFETLDLMDNMREVFSWITDPPDYQPSAEARLELLATVNEKVDEARAACERAEILRRVTELETLVRQLIADRGK